MKKEYYISPTGESVKYALSISKGNNYEFISFYPRHGALTSRGKLDKVKSKTYRILGNYSDTLNLTITTNGNKKKGGCISIFTNLRCDNVDFFNLNKKYVEDNTLQINDSLVDVNYGRDTLLYCENISTISLMTYNATYFSKDYEIDFSQGALFIDYIFNKELFTTHFFNIERDFIEKKIEIRLFFTMVGKSTFLIELIKSLMTCIIPQNGSVRQVAFKGSVQ